VGAVETSVGSSVGLLGRGPGFDSVQGQEVFLYSTASRASYTVGIRSCFSRGGGGVKRKGREAERSLRSRMVHPSPTRLHNRHILHASIEPRFRGRLAHSLKREEEEESGEVVRDTTFGGGVRNNISGFEGSQAVLTRQSGRGKLIA
jgi:hypothetical protein